MRVISGIIVMLCVFGFCVSGYAQGLVPESPEVQAAVAKAVDYLNRNGSKEARSGGKALIALALFKAGAEGDHPLIQSAIKDIRSKMTETITFAHPIYDIGICSMLVAELDPELYAEEMGYLCWALEYTQQTPGGWGYLSGGKPSPSRGGDMSMTQYAVMGAWTLYRNGGKISEPMMVKCANWLLHVQAPDGAYAYTSTISSQGTVSRDAVRPSTTAAGMASVYVLRDLFDMNGTKRPGAAEKDFIPPKAFRKIEEVKKDLLGAGSGKGLSRSDFLKVQEKGNQWLGNQFFTPGTNQINSKMQYYFYYLYAMERYFTFREMAERKTDPSPMWYNVIAKHLIETQENDGAWGSGPGLGKEVNAAYGVLVLLRSTKKSLGKSPHRFEGGSMQGGRGLPGSTDQLEVRDGQVISLSEMRSTESLLERLDEMEDWDEAAMDQLARMNEEELGGILSKNRSRIRQLVGVGSADLRLSAVRSLEKSGDVNNVPALIYALTDPDFPVAQAAQIALLNISRNPKGSRLPDSETENYEAKRKEIIENWKAWYLQIDPKAFFEGD